MVIICTTGWRSLSVIIIHWGYRCWMFLLLSSRGSLNVMGDPQHGHGQFCRPTGDEHTGILEVSFPDNQRYPGWSQKAEMVGVIFRPSGSHKGASRQHTMTNTQKIQVSHNGKTFNWQSIQKPLTNPNCMAIHQKFMLTKEKPWHKQVPQECSSGSPWDNEKHPVCPRKRLDNVKS